ncbi:DNA repair exonuclease [Neobacillus niacini]|uniref:metallophosphoesterase family protein n=1 Tax=Neobacillus niacini TaxID=86668 RepID=UPI0021CB799C|nr:DNA repair exonuclease [Neobacillus niacini]MCM3767358.1 DNA repair exonuclease [Neobacillus niacini]
MKKISFIHGADLHLDSPMVGLRHLPQAIFTRAKESTFTALKKLTSTAIERKVDFVILAGDLFDGEDRSLRAQSRFRSEMQKLAQHSIPVYIVHGNHDHLNGSWVHLDLPENVHVFGSTVERMVLVTNSGVTVHLYGFSYPTRHVYERKIDDYGKSGEADFHIGILHGNESSGTEHDNYAPFTVKDLLEKNFDYWALGHIHKRTVLSDTPPIIYPGNIQGRNKKESGLKGFYHISLNELGTEFTFVDCADIVWEEVEIDAAKAENFNDILGLCQSTIHSCRKNNAGTFLSLKLTNIHMEDEREKRTLNGELLDLLLDEEQSEDSFVWIIDITFSERKLLDKEVLIREANFYGELFETIEHFDNTENALAPLYEHRLGKKYLSHLSPAEQRELIERAEKLLIHYLYD